MTDADCARRNLLQLLFALVQRHEEDVAIDVAGHHVEYLATARGSACRRWRCCRWSRDGSARIRSRNVPSVSHRNAAAADDGGEQGKNNFDFAGGLAGKRCRGARERVFFTAQKGDSASSSRSYMRASSGDSSQAARTRGRLARGQVEFLVREMADEFFRAMKTG